MKEFIISSTSENIQKITSEILNNIPNITIKDEIYYDIKLIISELLINALLHGNKNNPNLKIYVKYEIKNNNFIFTVEDEGNGFDYMNIPNPLDNKNILKSSGRGIFLVKNLADKILFNEKGNRITIEKKLDKN